MNPPTPATDADGDGIVARFRFNGPDDRPLMDTVVMSAAAFDARPDRDAFDAFRSVAGDHVWFNVAPDWQPHRA